MDRYQLRIKRSAERDLRRLSRSMYERIKDRILALCDDPRPSGVRKLKGERDGWRIRVGDYRIQWRVWLRVPSGAKASISSARSDRFFLSGQEYRI